jgi:hypothetical protein
MRRSCSDSLLTASQSDGVFGSDSGAATLSVYNRRPAGWWLDGDVIIMIAQATRANKERTPPSAEEGGASYSVLSGEVWVPQQSNSRRGHWFQKEKAPPKQGQVGNL